MSTASNGTESWRNTYQSTKPPPSTRNNPSSIHFRRGRHQLSMRESTRANFFTSFRAGQTDLDEDVKVVPSLLKDNVRLFTTNKIGSEGLLYMKEQTFYRREEDPEYALSVSPDIYRKLVDEINDANSVPLGLYFCCHGGDGAHSGVADEDYVDIEVAYIVVGFFFVIIILLGWLLPNPDAMAA